MALHLLRTIEDPLRTLWVFRYYDLDERSFPFYGQALARLIDFIRALAATKDGGEQPTVNIIAHSMGGLIVREAIQRAYPERGERAADHINKVVTLGTPHQGISFTLLKEWIKIDAADELKHFDPEFQTRQEGRHRVRSVQRVLSARTAANGGRNELPHVWQRAVVGAQSPLLGLW